jgi:hypothetical protein
MVPAERFLKNTTLALAWVTGVAILAGCGTDSWTTAI